MSLDSVHDGVRTEPGFINSGVEFAGSDSRGFQLLIPPGRRDNAGVRAAGARVECGTPPALQAAS